MLLCFRGKLPSLVVISPSSTTACLPAYQLPNVSYPSHSTGIGPGAAYGPSVGDERQEMRVI